MTTIGQLIEALFTKYERRFQDQDLAAVATKRDLDRILRRGHHLTGTLYRFK